MAATRDRGTITLLDESSPGTVTLIDKDRDAFCMSVVEVISSCRIANAMYSEVSQIADLRDLLTQWIEDRKASIHSAHLSFRNDGILFVVMQNDVKRDNDLASDLADLDVAIAQDDRFNLLTVDVLSVPRSSDSATTAFLSSGRVQSYAGQE